MSFKSYKEKKKMLIDVWRDTVRQCEKNEIEHKDRSVKYPGMVKNMKCRIKHKDMEVNINNEDTLVMAEKFVKDGLNPAVLNMASNFKPGGGVRNGSSAQEEELFRRSNYFKVMYEEGYPLGKSDIIYSPKVTVIKDEHYKNFNKERRFDVAMIGCAAVRNPKITTDDSENSQCQFVYKGDYNLMKYKIESIFQTAYYHNNDSLVLGALGCGAFHGPSHVIASIMKEMVEKYNRCFKKIGFAVLSKGDKNYEIFGKVLFS